MIGCSCCCCKRMEEEAATTNVDAVANNLDDLQVAPVRHNPGEHYAEELPDREIRLLCVFCLFCFSWKERHPLLSKASAQPMKATLYSEAMRLVKWDVLRKLFFSKLVFPFSVKLII